MGRRRNIKADHIADLGDEVQIGGELEALQSVRFRFGTLAGNPRSDYDGSRASLGAAVRDCIRTARGLTPCPRQPPPLHAGNLPGRCDAIDISKPGHAGTQDVSLHPGFGDL